MGCRFIKLVRKIPSWRLVLKVKKSVRYCDNGIMAYEHWHREDNRYYHHREDGPAYIEYWKSVERIYEAWYINNKRHRIDGPARIYYNPDGTIYKNYYYISGERLSKEQWEDHPLVQEWLIKEAMKEALK